MYELYIGNEIYLSLTSAKSTVKKILEENQLEYIVIEADKSDGSKIIETISSQSIFENQRLFFVKRLYKNKDKENIIPLVLEFIEKNNDINIIFWEDQKVNSITRYVKFFKTRNLLKENNRLNKPSFVKYAKEYVANNNLRADSESVNLLCKYSNYDPERLENNIKKIKLYLDDNIITPEAIQNTIQDTLEEDIWALLDEINSPIGKPLIVLEKIFNQGIDSKYILPMIARNLRLLTMVKYMIENNKSYSEIASVLKIPPFTVGPLIDASRKYDWIKVRNKYEKLSNLDYEIKVGRIDPKLGLTLFCTTI